MDIDVVEWYYCFNCKEDRPAKIETYIEDVDHYLQTITVGVSLICTVCDDILDEDNHTFDMRQVK
jgi:hypothetical protein